MRLSSDIGKKNRTLFFRLWSNSHTDESYWGRNGKETYPFFYKVGIFSFVLGCVSAFERRYNLRGVSCETQILAIVRKEWC